MPLNLEKLRRFINTDPRTVDQIVREAKMTRSRLYQILRGERIDLPISTIDHLAAALRKKPRDLIE